MPTLRRNRPVALAIPDQKRLAQTSARRHQSSMPTCIRVPGVQCKDALRCKLRDAVSIRFQVVDQKDMLDLQRLDQIARIQRPRQVRQLQPAITDRSGNTKTRCVDPVPLLIADGKKLVDHLVEAGKLVRWKLLVAPLLQSSTGE